MANTWTPPVWIKSDPHGSAEFGVGHDDPSATSDVINRPRKGITGVLKRMLNLVQDQQPVNLTDQAIGIGLPGAVQAPAVLTNKSGSTLARGAVVAIALNAESATPGAVVAANTQSSLRVYVVALAEVANDATGLFTAGGTIDSLASGAIPIGAYIRKAASTLTVESTGVLADSGVSPPNGTLGIALQAAADGRVLAWWYGVPVHTAITLPTLARGTKVLGATFSTISEAFVNVPGMDLTLSVGARRALVTFQGEGTGVDASDMDGIGGASASIDGTDVEGANLLVRTHPVLNTGAPFAYAYVTDTLSSGNRTFRLRFKRASSASTTRLIAGARFSVQEVL